MKTEFGENFKQALTLTHIIMEDFYGVIIVVAFIFGILQIILFFKIWGMTNDASRIKDILESRLLNEKQYFSDQNNQSESVNSKDNDFNNDTKTGATVNAKYANQKYKTSFQNNQKDTTQDQDKKQEIADIKEDILFNENIKIGDTVIRLSDGRKMVVDSIDNYKFFCKASFIEGYRYYSSSEISEIPN